MLTNRILSSFYIIKSEYEVEDGYIDIALIARNYKERVYEALIELNYIKKSDDEVKKILLLKNNK